MELKLLGVLIIILKLPSLSSATRPRRFDNSLRRNGFKVQRKRLRLLGWCHTHPRLGMAGTWCLLITCKKPGSRSFIRSRTVVKQFQRFQGPLCRIVPTEVIFLLQVIQLGDNSEKLLGFGALHFHVPPVKRSDYTLLRRP